MANPEPPYHEDIADLTLAVTHLTDAITALTHLLRQMLPSQEQGLRPPERKDLPYERRG